MVIYETAEELMKKAYEARGKTFREIDKHNRLQVKGAKGGLGQVVEESYFEYQVNNDAEPDFANLGIELKVTPFKQNKNKTLSAKERLVLNIINYMDEAHVDFHTSSFWRKNRKLLLMFYEWREGVQRDDLKIIETILFEYPEEDLAIIKSDWKIINDKIKNGLAHELSESDTQFLGAATKGANKSSLRQQPYSDELAMQRAYALKNSYMTALVRQYISNEKLVYFSTPKELEEKSIPRLLKERFQPFIGLSMKEMATQLGIVVNPQNRAAVPNLISALLGLKGTNLNRIAEFAKANIQFKTVRLQQNGRPKESMSFLNINFDEVATESWDESYIKNYFEETQLLLVVFQYDEEQILRFKGIKLWAMPESTIQTDLFAYWSEIQKVINDGVMLKQSNRGVLNNFPKSNFNKKMHVRPKGADSNDKVMLPDGQWITKQAYWLNANYVAEIISDLEE